MNTLFLVEPDGSINYNNIQAFSSADYAFIFSFAQKLKESDKKNIHFGLNAKVIHRSVGKFAKAWGFGLDAGLQIFQDKWKFGIAAEILPPHSMHGHLHLLKKKKKFYIFTNNEIPVKSTELTAPRLVLGIARDFKIRQKSKPSCRSKC